MATFSKLAAIIAFTFTIFLLPSACPGQAPNAPALNTASAGVRPADIEAAVAAICPAADVTRSKTGGAHGCRVCPEGTDSHGLGFGNWEMYAETPGHFTSPQADNLILYGTQCDSHASNYGGSFIFAIESGKARLLKYDKGLTTGECYKFAYPDGRDFLICRSGWSGQGEAFGTIEMDSFNAGGDAISTKLITTHDTTGTCGDAPVEVAQESDVTDIKPSLNASGAITGLTLTARLGDVKCSDVNSDQNKNRLAAHVRFYRIEFLFDGKNFNVAPASRAALNRFTTD
jgi:hypothetical protein